MNINITADDTRSSSRNATAIDIDITADDTWSSLRNATAIDITADGPNSSNTVLSDSHRYGRKIETFLKTYTDEINLILFVFKKGRFTAEERDVFEIIRSKLKTEIFPISALAVTQCKNDTHQERAKLTIKSFPPTKIQSCMIASQMRMGIHSVGFPPSESIIATTPGSLYKDKEQKKIEKPSET